MNQRAGIGRYAREMVRHLLPLVSGYSKTLWYAPGPEPAPENLDFLEEATSLDHVLVRRSHISRQSVDRLYFRAGLPVGPFLDLGKARLMYSPDFTVPRIREARRAVTIHDLAWQIRPEFAPPGLRRFLDRAVPRQIASADVVFTVSESSRNDILERYRIPASTVVVASNAADQRFFAASTRDNSGLESLGVPPDYLLMVGSIEPRKNHLAVLQALDQIPDCPPLIVVGSRGWADQAIVEAIAGAEERGSAKMLGYVPDIALPQLYACSTAVISASWYEGFGLPILEALSTGARVAASDIPAHREVAGDFAHFFDPGSVESIADGIITVLAGLQPQGAALHSQQNWASRFSWQRSASQVWETLKVLT